mmetsp:Transcript_18375/g.22496  ORF Transcript_18375/g.22496 Transcript_18375/m.22496 type:complete len:104 (+) Transcript_18375:2898-3209(+)
MLLVDEEDVMVLRLVRLRSRDAPSFVPCACGLSTTISFNKLALHGANSVTTCSHRRTKKIVRLYRIVIFYILLFLSAFQDTPPSFVCVVLLSSHLILHENTMR